MARSKLRLVGDHRPDWSAEARGPISPIFLALIAGFIASGVALWRGFGSDRAGTFIFVLTGWLISLCLHEFMHAAAAYWGGDHTVAGKGYLRLDPMRYGHPVLTFILPMVYLLIGALPLPGGAVMIENHRLRSKFRDSMTSLAGPAANIVSAGILLTVLAVADPAYQFGNHLAFWSALSFLAYLQVATAILNLIPIPGLDGYGVIEPYLSGEWRRLGNQIRPYGLLIMFLLLFALPQTRHLISNWSIDIMTAVGAPTGWVGLGQFLFQFWKN